MTCERCPDRGMCCRYVELPLARTLNADERKWVSLHRGLEVRGLTVRFNITCSALTDEGLCSLHGTPERPEMCALWPDDARNQAPEGCVFIELQELERVK